jgi:hypothetical protein
MKQKFLDIIYYKTKKSPKGYTNAVTKGHIFNASVQIIAID